MANMETSGDWPWRNSMKPVRFFALDARVALFFLLFLVHMRPWTLGTFVFVSAVFWFLERKGLTFEASIRSFPHLGFGREPSGPDLAPQT